MNIITTLIPIINSLFTLAALVGGVFVFRNAKKAGIIQIQSDTIVAMQQQIEALKTGQAALQKDNGHLQYVIETISSALKQKGIIISIEGEMVTLEDMTGRTSSVRRSTRQPSLKKDEGK